MKLVKFRLLLRLTYLAADLKDKQFEHKVHSKYTYRFLGSMKFNIGILSQT